MTWVLAYGSTLATPLLVLVCLLILGLALGPIYLLASQDRKKRQQRLAERRRKRQRRLEDRPRVWRTAAQRLGMTVTKGAEPGLVGRLSGRVLEAELVPRGLKVSAKLTISRLAERALGDRAVAPAGRPKRTRHPFSREETAAWRHTLRAAGHTGVRALVALAGGEGAWLDGDRLRFVQSACTTDAVSLEKAVRDAAEVASAAEAALQGLPELLSKVAVRATGADVARGAQSLLFVLFDGQADTDDTARTLLASAHPLVRLESAKRLRDESTMRELALDRDLDSAQPSKVRLDALGWLTRHGGRDVLADVVGRVLTEGDGPCLSVALDQVKRERMGQHRAAVEALLVVAGGRQFDEAVDAIVALDHAGSETALLTELGCRLHPERMAVVTALGKMGSPRAIEGLNQIESSEESEQLALDVARTLISARHGLDLAGGSLALVNNEAGAGGLAVAVGTGSLAVEAEPAEPGPGE